MSELEVRRTPRGDIAIKTANGALYLSAEQAAELAHALIQLVTEGEVDV